MPLEIQPAASVRVKAHQLALPFVVSGPPVPATLPVVVETIPPPGLWPSLSAATRAQVRQQILRVAREVLRDGHRS